MAPSHVEVIVNSSAAHWIRLQHLHATIREKMVMRQILIAEAAAALHVQRARNACLMKTVALEAVLLMMKYVYRQSSHRHAKTIVNAIMANVQMVLAYL
jgi:hypothetical protein